MDVHAVAAYLHINEKKVYELASKRELPGTKVTGKWLFPKELVDQWLIESSHAGVLADRLLITGSDDPLLQRAIWELTGSLGAHGIVSYTACGTKLGLALLAAGRADVCGLHWGPAEESAVRHPALLQVHSSHSQWILVRACRRQQGLMVRREYWEDGVGIDELLRRSLRWVFRQQGAGTQRFLEEVSARQNVELGRFQVVARARSEREAASMIALGAADLAPGVCAAAREFGVGFVPVGWECFDLALRRGTYFRTMFQQLMDVLRGAAVQQAAELLGGYDLSETGRLVWSR